MKLKHLTFSLIFLFFANQLLAQNNDDFKRLQLRLRADSLVLDAYNGDGVFIARQKSSQKWAMFQGVSDRKLDRFTPFAYDSLGFFDKHPHFTIVKKNNKYGVILSPWRNDGKAIESIACTFDKLAIVEDEGWGGSQNMLAAQKDGKWGYIHEETGATLIPFVFKTKAELPSPNRNFYKDPTETFSVEMMRLFNRPDTITKLNLAYQNLAFVPKQIKKCTNLTFLNLEGNKLTQLPEEVGELHNLKTLYLGFNHDLFTGYEKQKNLDVLQKLSNLEYLSIGNIKKTDNKRTSAMYSCNIDIPADFQISQKLKGLSIGCAFYTEEVPAFIYQLNHLEELIIHNALPNNPINFNFDQFKSKSTIQILSLGKVSSLENFNQNIHHYQNLKELSLFLLKPKGKLDGLKKLKKLEDLYIKIDEKISEGSKYYKVITIADYSMHTYRSDKPITEEQLLKTIAEYNMHLQEK
ncbi:leucine-rich repeat domain-containing protein [Psychroflexus salis]|uniref:Leucine rich repeat-containing protein n=1 Tax=Psychroflexus salis TaxID=1526574 RepID=A0A916ZNT5_9FLAO|nr:leucine-rich repeat domain-containing protein [Psychroflexus salis]GGE05313.1 hypothetical protein GCM10010831_03740 [Psychroflexus salis]